MQAKRKYVYRESRDQQFLVAWFELQYPDVLIAKFHNENNYDVAKRVRLKKEGLLTGIPDLIIFAARGESHGLLIEMKETGGRASTVQKNVVNKLNSSGYYACIAFGFLEGQKIVKEYMQGESW